MSDQITVRGFVGTEIRRFTTDSGVCIASFELGSVERRQDKATNEWVDGDTNWYHVSAFRQLAQNAAFSITKGQRVIVTGRLKIRQWSRDDGKTGTSVNLDADTIGHDLFWGTAMFQRHTVQRKEAPAPARGDGEAAEVSTSGPEGTSGPESGSTDDQGPDGTEVPDDASALVGSDELVDEATGEILAAEPTY